MSVKIYIPPYLQPFVNNTEVFEAKGSTVGECLNYLLERSPDIANKLFNKKGELHGYVAIYINEEDAYPDELARSIKDGDKIHILYIIGGG
ncbi:MoaD/ThiS family protein [Chloroflexota bacterium]